MPCDNSTTHNTYPEGFQVAFGVSIGSTSIQGFYLTPSGEILPLFTEDDSTRWTTKALKESKELIREFFEYLVQYTYNDRVGILFNSFGYAFDGGKCKTPGAPFAWVEDTETFKDKSFVGLMAEVIEENPEYGRMFLAVNRNWKTEHGEEVGGQWAKQINDYLETHGIIGCEWLIDLGGRSGTLYHREGEIFVKRETIFKDTTPNSLVDTPSDFLDYFNMEMAKLQQAGIDVTKLAVLQTGEMREKNVEGIFSTGVMFHDYLPQEVESNFEAIDFMRTVLRTNEASSFTMTPLDDYKIQVIPEPGMGIFGRFWSSLMYSIFG